jgi:hypothetical protein
MGNLAHSIDAHNNRHPFSINAHHAQPIWAPSADFAVSRNQYLEERRREKIRREKRLKNWDIKSLNIISFNHQEHVPLSHHRHLVW